MNKKLMLSKETLRVLEAENAREVAGGTLFPNTILRTGQTCTYCVSVGGYCTTNTQQK